MIFWQSNVHADILAFVCLIRSAFERPNLFFFLSGYINAPFFSLLRQRKRNKRKAAFCQKLRWQKVSSARFCSSLFGSIALVFLPICTSIGQHRNGLAFEWPLSIIAALYGIKNVPSYAIVHLCHLANCLNNYTVLFELSALIKYSISTTYQNLDCHFQRDCMQ